MTVSVIIPALNEEATIAGVVSAVLADDPREVLVIDADSTDATAARAGEAGAHVLNWREIMPNTPPVTGKGESLWRGVYAARGDIVCFVDGDLVSPAPGLVNALVERFADPEVAMVKASYERTFQGQPTGGGRVTELTAKPLIDLYHPHLSHLDQPLAGEYALRRSVALKVPFVSGYGVEAGLLCDVAAYCGANAIAQACLPARVHRNRPLNELRPMATTVAAVLLQRAGLLDVDHPAFPGERPPLSASLSTLK